MYIFSYLLAFYLDKCMYVSREMFRKFIVYSMRMRVIHIRNRFEIIMWNSHMKIQNKCHSNAKLREYNRVGEFCEWIATDSLKYCSCSCSCSGMRFNDAMILEGNKNKNNNNKSTFQRILSVNYRENCLECLYLLASSFSFCLLLYHLYVVLPSHNYVYKLFQFK